MKEKAGSRVDYSAPTTSIGAIARAAAFYEIHHVPKRGITSQEIVEKYDLGESWYEYEGSPRRVNLAGQLVRNELADAFKKGKLNKVWSPKTGGLVRRNGYVVYFNPGTMPDREVDYWSGIPDPKKWRA